MSEVSPAKKLLDAFTILQRWSMAGSRIVQHIEHCAECQAAHQNEAKDRPHKYCPACDILWAEMMILEANVIAILPDLPEEARNEVGDFKFMTGHNA
jgi:hypothetical protein